MNDIEIRVSPWILAQRVLILAAILLLFYQGYNHIDDILIIEHESAHKQISEYHGCINGTTIIYDDGGSYRCNQYSQGRTADMAKEENILQSMNEIVTYNIKVLIMAILFGSLLICVTMMILKD